MANNFELILGPQDWIGRQDSAQPPDRGVVQGREYLAYDESAEEHAWSKHFAMPAAYTGSGTLKLDVDFIMASATSGSVAWQVYVEAVTPGDAEDVLTTTNNDGSSNDETTGVPGTAGHLGRSTITLTNKDSVAAGDLMRVLLLRRAPLDDASGDCRVLNVTLREEV